MSDFNNLGTPWWVTSSGSRIEADYTLHRSTAVTYTMDDLIGRRDVKKYTLTTNDTATVSGEGTVLR